ncbi:MAG: haloacid dehalogenase-like hydrolase, partial [Cyanobacteria bacterium J06641_5]
MENARIVFCDFDGTITVEDTFAGAIAPLVPEAAERILPALFARQMTLRQGVRELLGAVPSDRYADILAYAAKQPIRAGFADLLAWLEARQVPLVVVSGGIEGMVRAVLDRPGRDGRPLSDRVTAIS